MKEYKEQNGCWNCEYVFENSGYDDPPHYYCTVNNDRPICGDSFIGEEFPGLYEKDIDVYEIHSDRWNEWATTYEVQPYGICNLYNKRK
ncbi:MAG: hypothetical protein ACOC33_03740 [bacterium]